MSERSYSNYGEERIAVDAENSESPYKAGIRPFRGAVGNGARGRGVYIYKMTLGRFEVTVENDWFERNGLYTIGVASNAGEGMRLFYDPDTLEENYEAEEKNRADVRKEQCDGCALYQAAQRERA